MYRDNSYGGGSGEKQKINWVAWSKVCKGNGKGGLGVANILDHNRALVSKWIWKFGTAPASSLWKMVVCNKYRLLSNRTIPKLQNTRRLSFFAIDRKSTRLNSSH